MSIPVDLIDMKGENQCQSTETMTTGLTCPAAEEAAVKAAPAEAPVAAAAVKAGPAAGAKVAPVAEEAEVVKAGPVAAAAVKVAPAVAAVVANLEPTRNKKD